MEVVIEAATEADVPAILEVLKTANMHHVPSEEMPDPDWKRFFVARSGGEVLGAAGYTMVSPGTAKTTLMAVRPEARRLGLGRRLQERRMLAALDEGAETLTTNADIPETIAWYKKHFGYREIGRIKKLHEFGRADVHEWTTLETDLREWRKSRDA
jgi:ribosomal-protein-alanine N-acetyltransferase